MPRNLTCFFVLTYLLSWAWWLPLAFSGVAVVAGSTPTHIPGLLGPAIAALIVSGTIEGKEAFNDLVRRVLLVRFSWIGWLAALAPFGFLLIGVVVARIVEGAWPNPSGLGRYSGVPQYGAVAVLSIVFLANGFGEEIGWRGYALPRLQARFGARIGTLILYPIWAFWHLPTFWFLASFMQMNATTIVFGWGLGILAGTLVLANVAKLASGSILAVALWHFAYNAAAATDLGETIPMVTTLCVMAWAVFLAWREWTQPAPSPLLVPAPPAANRSQ